MNKLLFVGAAAAQYTETCGDAFTKQAYDKLEALKADKAALDAATAGLTAAATAEKTSFDIVKGRATAQETLIAPFNTALATAKTNYDNQFNAKAAATTAIDATTAPIAAADAALTASKALETAQQAKIDAQALINAKLETAYNDHVTEKASMQSLLDAATTALTTATTALTTATNAKIQFQTDRAKTTAPKGTGKELIDATAAVSTPQTEYNTAVSDEAAKWAIYKPSKLAFDKKTKEKGYLDAACDFTDGSAFDCTGQTNNPVTALVTAAASALTGMTSSNTTAKNNWDATVTTLATKKDVLAQKNAAKDAWTDLDTISGNTVTTLTAAETTATSAKTAATAAKTTATINLQTVEGQVTQANTDWTRGKAVTTALNAAMAPLADDVVVKTYMKKVETDKLAVQEAAKTAAGVRLAEYLVVKNMAQETVDRATTTLNFYNGLLATAQEQKDLVDGAVTKNATAITNATAAVTAQQTLLDSMVSSCKQAGYAKAQLAMKDLLAKTAADQAAATAVATAYEAKSAFSTTGGANTDCAYPKEPGLPRPKCNDEFCCGAAQKILRDGTKIAVETCQNALTTRTYQYYPPLPAGATVEPTPETWRFQCISGAKNLVAGAAAALAATYMMA